MIMKKLIQGILDFRKRCLADYRKSYSYLAAGQAPDYLLVTCSDSRVAPNIFASTNPGDVFVVRNVGNLIPPAHSALAQAGAAEGAAIDFALQQLPVKEIIVCGHSDCGAMRAILSGIDLPHLQDWLHCAGCAKIDLVQTQGINHDLTEINQLAQANVLKQLTHLKTYPAVQKRLDEGTLNLHGWYFDIAHGDVYNFEGEFNQFTLIDEEEARRILKRLK